MAKERYETIERIRCQAPDGTAQEVLRQKVFTYTPSMNEDDDWMDSGYERLVTTAGQPVSKLKDGRYLIVKQNLVLTPAHPTSP